MCCRFCFLLLAQVVSLEYSPCLALSATSSSCGTMAYRTVLRNACHKYLSFAEYALLFGKMHLVTATNSLVGASCSSRLIPETRGVSLEHMDQLFDEFRGKPSSENSTKSRGDDSLMAQQAPP